MGLRGAWVGWGCQVCPWGSQSAPPDTKTGCAPNVGLYPLGVEATQKAAEWYNARPADQQVTYTGFQVVTWYAEIAASPSATHPGRQ